MTTKEIIKDKPSLNGNYCLATKEHYDKLVEDGYEETGDFDNYEYVFVDVNGLIDFFKPPYLENEYNKPYPKPMHLHNNEWVFGSLEHEETKAEIEKYFIDLAFPPEPVERIKEILKGIDKEECDADDGWWETSTGAEFGAKKLKEIIEYFESNQKGKK